MSKIEKLPTRGAVALAAVLAVFATGSLGVGCGSDTSSSETSTEAPTSQQQQKHPKRPPRVPSEGGTTTIETAP